MYQVRTYNNLAQAGLDVLDQEGYLHGENITQPDAILCRSQNLHQEKFPDSLLAIFRAGTGVNNIPLDLCSQRGIAVFNAPGANTNSVKELVIGAMITLSRNVLPALEWMENLSGEDIPARIEKEKKRFNGHEISGKTMAIVGLGNIGSQLARACLSLGMDVIAYDPFLKNVIHETNFYQTDDIDEIFKKADIMSFHVPLNEATRNMANEERLALTKPGVMLINYARDGIVDSKTLAKLLQSNHVAAYISDFYEPQLAGIDNVYTTPHLGASTEEAQMNAVVMAAESLVLYLKTGEIVNSVNLPNIRLTFESPYRLAIINENIPNMIAEISSGLGSLNINIDKISNQAKGSIAYTLVDISGQGVEVLIPEVINPLKARQGIIRVRLIENKLI